MSDIEMGKDKFNFKKAIIAFFIAIIGGILGRLGGWDKGNRMFRLIGVPLCCVVLMALLYHPLSWWYAGSLLLTFGAVLGTTSTYYKKKGKPVRWWNWFIYGAMEGIAFLPVVLYSQNWLGFAIRTSVCATLIFFWDELIDIDWLEEFGRYFIVVMTVPLLLIGG